MDGKKDDIVMAYDPQSGALSQTSRSSVSAASQRIAKDQNGHCDRSRKQRRKAPPIDRGPEEFEYHFRGTPLGFSESYFADSQQHHCTFASRNNSGTVLSESPGPSETDSSDDEVTVVDRDNAALSTGVQRQKRVRFGGVLQASIAISLSSDSSDGHDHDETDNETDNKTDDEADDETGEASERLAIKTPESTNLGESGAELEEDTDDSAAEDVQPNKPPYLPHDDLFKDRWFSDPWDRRPGEMWTNAVQDQHNLRAAIKERGFTGPRAAWLFSELQKRKGSRFPYQEKTSLKKSEKTHTEYLSALKRRNEEAFARENQVKEYDEGVALEEIKWTLGLWDMVYGPDWPHDAAKTNISTSDIATDKNETDNKSEEEPSPKRHRTDQRTSTAGRSREVKVSAVINGLSDPGPDQRASRQEMEKSDREFRAHKAKMLEAARKEREKADIRDFIRSAENRKFSSGYRESWK
jgi:hypothetical protein